MFFASIVVAALNGCVFFPIVLSIIGPHAIQVEKSLQAEKPTARNLTVASSSTQVIPSRRPSATKSSNPEVVPKVDGVEMTNVEIAWTDDEPVPITNMDEVRPNDDASKRDSRRNSIHATEPTFVQQQPSAKENELANSALPTLASRNSTSKTNPDNASNPPAYATSSFSKRNSQGSETKTISGADSDIVSDRRSFNRTNSQFRKNGDLQPPPAEFKGDGDPHNFAPWGNLAPALAALTDE